MIKKSESRFEKLFEKSGDAMLFIHNQKFTECNDATIRMLGYRTKEEFLNTHPSELSPEFQPDGRSSNEMADKMMQIAIDQGTHRFEWIHTKKGGECFPVEVLLTSISNELNNEIIHVTWRDITSLKNDEQALRDSEEKYKTIYNNTVDSLWLIKVEENGLELNFRFSSMNQSGLGVTGLKQENLVGQLMENILPPGSHKLVREKYTEVVNTKKIVEYIEVADLPNGTKHGAIKVVPILGVKGEVVQLLGIANDITEQRKQEMIIKEQQLLQETMMNTIADGVAIYNDQFLPIVSNDKAYQILNLTEDQYYQRSLYNPSWRVIDAFGKKLEASDFPVVKSFKTGEKFTDFVLGVLQEDEEVTWISVNTNFIDIATTNNKAKEHVVVSFSDITDKVEKRKSDEIRSVAFESMTEGFCIQDENAKILNMNDSACEILGLTKEQMEGRDSFDSRWSAIKEDGSPFLGEEYPVPISLATGKTLENIIMGVNKPSGELTWISINSSPFYFGHNSEGKLPNGAIATFTDITEIKKTEQELKESEEKYKEIFNSFTDVYYEVNIEGEIQVVSPSVIDVTGYNVEELLGTKISNKFKFPEQREEMLKKLVQTGEMNSFQFIYINKLGEDTLIEANIRLVKNEKGEPIGTRGTLRNIGDREKLNQAILRLEEKDTMLKEIHHRVKNNLQVVTSLLSLQSSFINEEEVKALFKYAQHRINTMSVVHEMLYQSDNLSNINYTEYLNKLLSGLIISMKGVDNNIRLNIEAPDVSLNIDTSIPLGLLVNEVVTNSLKYGIKGDNKGIITVELEQLEKLNFILTIGDDGEGFSNELTFKNTNSLGLKLIHKLVLQLKGSAEKDNSKKGTHYVILFQ